VERLKIGNKETLNLSAYAVGDAEQLFVTIINKEYGAGARSATVTIQTPEFSANHVKAIFLLSEKNDATAKDGITLGGAPIENDAPWNGTWKVLNDSRANQINIIVPATSAVVVKLERSIGLN